MFYGGWWLVYCTTAVQKNSVFYSLVWHLFWILSSLKEFIWYLSINFNMFWLSVVTDCTFGLIQEACVKCDLVGIATMCYVRWVESYCTAVWFALLPRLLCWAVSRGAAQGTTPNHTHPQAPPHPTYGMKWQHRDCDKHKLSQAFCFPLPEETQSRSTVG